MFQGFFNYDNDIWRFVGRLADIMVLNLLWILFSLPIVTFGISTTALYYCTLKIVKDEDDGNIRMFLRSFKKNWKEGLIIWLILRRIWRVIWIHNNYAYNNKKYEYYSRLSSFDTRSIAAKSCFASLVLTL